SGADDTQIPDEVAREIRKQKKNGVEVDWVIDAIEQRKNSLIRPPVANLDYLLAVIPCASPEPDLLTADKLTVIAENAGIETVVVIGKTDLNPQKSLEYAAVYEKAGYRVFRISCETGEGVDVLRDYIAEISSAENGYVSGAFAGVSGAGKSTLMTALFPDLQLKTGVVSRKTERGRHTTRHVELYPIPVGEGIFWLADTPGFSMLDFTRFDFFPYDELAGSFREFSECLGECRYTKCTHLKEEGCAVIEKMKDGRIAPSRHDSYIRIYEEQRSVPEWKRR
ncbi:MAG: ribosome small subunit-dependent GTPase A, partial [Clostridia bacterium]|nr:ribosome small subunit-dependent GTPase A [Clostridia bacterium]